MRHAFLLLGLLTCFVPPPRVPALPALPAIPTGVFYVTNYGARPDGVSTNTAAFQAAFDDAARHGGGSVVASGLGVFLCGGGLVMHSHTRFRIDAGTTVKLLPYGKYPGPTVGKPATPRTSWLTLDQGGHDFELCGPGLLNGEGQTWWPARLRESGRPYEIYLRHASRVFIHDWHSINPPMKHIVMDGDNYDITVKHVTNSSPDMTPSQNTDCLNLLGTRCLVQDCSFQGCDDNIAIGRGAGACVDTLITNVTCGTGHGISFGSVLPAGGISNVTVVNCTFCDTENGIRFKSDNDKAHGGAVQNIQFLNIGMTNVKRPIIIYSHYNQFGSPDRITPAIVAATPAAPVTANTPIWRDILISNVWGTAAAAAKRTGIIWGRTELLVSNVTLQHVRLTVPATFDVFNARGVRFVDCDFMPASNSFPTYTLYNAELTISNSSLNPRPVSFDGLVAATNWAVNWLSLHRTQATLTRPDVLGTRPRLGLGSTLSTGSNNPALTGSSALKARLGTNARTSGVPR